MIHTYVVFKFLGGVFFHLFLSYLLQIVQISSVVEPVARSYISYTSVSDRKSANRSI
jgi:hypothetical protein